MNEGAHAAESCVWQFTARREDQSVMLVLPTSPAGGSLTLTV